MTNLSLSDQLSTLQVELKPNGVTLTRHGDQRDGTQRFHMSKAEWTWLLHRAAHLEEIIRKVEEQQG